MNGPSDRTSRMGQLGAVGHEVLSDRQWRDLTAAFRLSDREAEVVLSVVDDLKESAIASRLGISPHTVHTHIERLYRKLGVRSRVELLTLLFSEHLRQLSDSLVRATKSSALPKCFGTGRCCPNYLHCPLRN